MASNVEVGLVVTLICCGISILLGPFNIIRGYLIQKPYGMQTIFDRVVIDYTQFCQIAGFSYTCVMTYGVLFRLDFCHKVPVFSFQILQLLVVVFSACGGISTGRVCQF